MAGRPTNLSVPVLSITTVLGRGVLPSGQRIPYSPQKRKISISEEKELLRHRLHVTCFHGLNEASTVPLKATGIQTNRDAAQTFIVRLVTQTSFNVLQEQGRSALLLDAVISAILDQLSVQINHEPHECKELGKDPPMFWHNDTKKPYSDQCSSENHLVMRMGNRKARFCVAASQLDDVKMKSCTKVAKLPTDPIVISLLATIFTAFGCGVIPAGQASTRNFVVTGFTLPVAMVYTNMDMISAQHPGIAGSRDGVQAFVSRIVMQTVFDVLESNGRRALLPDAVILSILDQLNVTITYQPM
ncbi:hypothetical protein KIN20_016326 [Parelaphostrongylus tenuis]|uniref:Uncharacterized protein n=1 Tax=Parelaphostrongylus tenuis TaxID=148309 RepID=A0AAD5N1T2_PARTN|nr:hypothetical protein KIN20_016326 [Parelaphostrongylus tenuis]